MSARFGKGRRVTLIFGLGTCLFILTMGFIYHEDIAVEYSLYRMKENPTLFLRQLGRREKSVVAARATRMFLQTEQGKEAALNAYLSVVVEIDSNIIRFFSRNNLTMLWVGDTGRLHILCLAFPEGSLETRFPEDALRARLPVTKRTRIAKSTRREWVMCGRSILSTVLLVVGCDQPRIVAVCGAEYPEISKDTAAFLQCDVPGTVIYSEGRRLGVAPLELKDSWFIEHELDVVGPGNMFGMVDSYGSVIWLYKSGLQALPLMIAVPTDVAEGYCSIETPWGRRTRIGGTTTKMTQFSCYSPMAHSGPLVLRFEGVSRESDVLVAHVVIENRAEHMKRNGSLTFHYFSTRTFELSKIQKVQAEDWHVFEPGATKRGRFPLDPPMGQARWAVYPTYIVSGGSEGNVIANGDTLIVER